MKVEAIKAKICNVLSMRQVYSFMLFIYYVMRLLIHKFREDGKLSDFIYYRNLLYSITVNLKTNPCILCIVY